MRRVIKNSTKFRFVVVGCVNTAIDFGLLYILTAVGLPVALANIISSTSAFIFSFFANKKYAFKTVGTDVRREMVLFVIVTLFGLWVLQTIVIGFCLPLFSGIVGSTSIGLLLAKLAATLVSMVWNYITYSQLVFKKS